MLKNQLRKLQESMHAPMPLPLPSELQLATCHYSIHIVYKCCCIYCDMHKRLGKCLDKIACVVLCSCVVQPSANIVVTFGGFICTNKKKTLTKITQFLRNNSKTVE